MQFCKENLPRFSLLVLLASVVYCVVFVNFGVLQTNNMHEAVLVSIYGIGISLVFCLVVVLVLILGSKTERLAMKNDFVDFLRDVVAYVICMTGAAGLTHLAVPLSEAIHHATNGSAPLLIFSVGWGWQIAASFFYCGMFMAVGGGSEWEYDARLLFGPRY